ncbi:uncharacterized protein LOC141913847 [Tubulanus polymorphus]|uniref:uncharacterized protein LOC141913847 n=1 Tax=Tubulanus polymorphus TaxID=672921 RepID=UPI003DA6C9ED
MSRLILFNERRRAEVKDLKLCEYLNRPKWHQIMNDEMKSSLKPMDILLAKRMDMVVCAGKSRKNVESFILLPPEAKSAIDILNAKRDTVGTLKANAYVFARPNAITPFTGNTELKEIVTSCPNISYPERICSTSLRKYIATVSQILDMAPKEVEYLARHLGHDVKTHIEYYRLSSATVELSKVSQLLIAVDAGHVNRWEGKQLSEISTEDLPSFDDDSSADSSADNSGEDISALATSKNFCSADEPCSSSLEICVDTVEDEPCISKSLTRVDIGKTKSKGTGTKRRWSAEEDDTFQQIFHSCIRCNKMPNRELLDKATQVLKTRTLLQIRTRVSNMIKKRKISK